MVIDSANAPMPQMEKIAVEGVFAQRHRQL